MKVISAHLGFLADNVGKIATAMIPVHVIRQMEFAALLDANLVGKGAHVTQSVTKEHLDKTAALHAIASQVQPVIISMATVLIMCVLQDGRTITAAQVRT